MNDSLVKGIEKLIHKTCWHCDADQDNVEISAKKLAQDIADSLVVDEDAMWKAHDKATIILPGAMHTQFSMHEFMDTIKTDGAITVRGDDDDDAY